MLRSVEKPEAIGAISLHSWVYDHLLRVIRLFVAFLGGVGDPVMDGALKLLCHVRRGEDDRSAVEMISAIPVSGPNRFLTDQQTEPRRPFHELNAVKMEEDGLTVTLPIDRVEIDALALPDRHSSLRATAPRIGQTAGSMRDRQQFSGSCRGTFVLALFDG